MSVPIGQGSAAAPRRPLTRERVLQAALEYADREGLDALSMHKLGAELGVRGMSLYNHVQGKDGLLDGMVELMWQELHETAKPRPDWRESLRALSAAVRDLVHRHPNVAPLLVSRRLIPGGALRVTDAHLKVMRDGGIPEDCSILMLRTVFAHGFGFALGEISSFASASPVSGETDIQRIRRIATLIPSDVPDNLAQLAFTLCDQCGPSANSELGITLMIRGLECYLSEARE